MGSYNGIRNAVPNYLQSPRRSAQQYDPRQGNSFLSMKKIRICEQITAVFSVCIGHRIWVCNVIFLRAFMNAEQEVHSEADKEAAKEILLWWSPLSK